MARASLQQEIRDYLGSLNLDYEDHTESFDDLDFSIRHRGELLIRLEVKEKRQAYNPRNCPTFADESDLFILDDLTVRKSLGFAPRSGILVRDYRQPRYCFFSVIDLALMPRLRVNRRIHGSEPIFKGKWLINLQNGQHAKDLPGAFVHIRQYLLDLDGPLFKMLECYGEYQGESIENAGRTRRPRYWKKDVSSTK